MPGRRVVIVIVFFDVDVISRVAAIVIDIDIDIVIIIVVRVAPRRWFLVRIIRRIVVGGVAIVVLVHVLRRGRRFRRSVDATIAAAAAVFTADGQVPEFLRQQVPGGLIPRIELDDHLECIAGLVGALEALLGRAFGVGVGVGAFAELVLGGFGLVFVGPRQGQIGFGEAEMTLGPLAVDVDALFGRHHRGLRLGSTPQLQAAGDRVAQQDLLVEPRGEGEVADAAVVVVAVIAAAAVGVGVAVGTKAVVLALYSL